VWLVSRLPPGVADEKGPQRKLEAFCVLRLRL